MDYDTDNWLPELTGPQGLGLGGGALALAGGALAPQLTVRRGADVVVLSLFEWSGWLALVVPTVFALLAIGAIAQQWGYMQILTTRMVGVAVAGGVVMTLVVWWPLASEVRRLVVLDGVGGVQATLGAGIFLTSAGLVAALAAASAPTVRGWATNWVQ